MLGKLLTGHHCIVSLSAEVVNVPGSLSWGVTDRPHEVLMFLHTQSAFRQIRTSKMLFPIRPENYSLQELAISCKEHEFLASGVAFARVLQEYCKKILGRKMRDCKKNAYFARNLQEKCKSFKIFQDLVRRMHSRAR